MSYLYAQIHNITKVINQSVFPFCQKKNLSTQNILSCLYPIKWKAQINKKNGIEIMWMMHIICFSSFALQVSVAIAIYTQRKRNIEEISSNEKKNIILYELYMTQHNTMYPLFADNLAKKSEETIHLSIKDDKSFGPLFFFIYFDYCCCI